MRRLCSLEKSSAGKGENQKERTRSKVDELNYSSDKCAIKDLKARAGSNHSGGLLKAHNQPC